MGRGGIQMFLEGHCEASDAIFLGREVAILLAFHIFIWIYFINSNEVPCNTDFIEFMALSRLLALSTSLPSPPPLPHPRKTHGSNCLLPLLASLSMLSDLLMSLLIL